MSSEVGRAINATRAENDKRAKGAIDRALDLLDAIIEVLVIQKSPRIKEILRVRDEFLRLFFEGTFDKDVENIAHYFNWFKIAARSHTYQERRGLSFG